MRQLTPVGLKQSELESSHPESTSSSSTTTSSLETSLSKSVSPPECTGLCCSNECEPFQPKGTGDLRCLTRNRRKILPLQYPWLSVCMTTREVYCFYCKYAMKHNLVVFSNNSNPAFTTNGFNNWKKAHEKFSSHTSSHVHKEAQMKWLASLKPSLPECFSSQIVRLQTTRRKALICQLSHLLRQGLAVRGHTELEGNLRQLLMMWSNTSNENVTEWLTENWYMSHDN